jgi:hypothetical protein
MKAITEIIDALVTFNVLIKITEHHIIEYKLAKSPFKLKVYVETENYRGYVDIVSIIYRSGIYVADTALPEIDVWLTPRNFLVTEFVCFDDLNSRLLQAAYHRTRDIPVINY